MHSRCGSRDTTRSLCQIESTFSFSHKSTHCQKAFPPENGNSDRPNPTLIVMTAPQISVMCGAVRRHARAPHQCGHGIAS